MTDKQFERLGQSLLKVIRMRKTHPSSLVRFNLELESELLQKKIGAENKRRIKVSGQGQLLRKREIPSSHNAFTAP